MEATASAAATESRRSRRRKDGQKRLAAKFGNRDTLGSKEMATATEVPSTEARRGAADEDDGGSFSWG